MLDEGETADASVVDVQLLLDDGHPRTHEVAAAPGGEVAPRSVADRREQLLPGTVPESVRREKIVDAAAECLLTHEVVELLEDTGRLVVDDRAVVALGLVQVRKLLPHRRRAGGRVDVVSGRL